jgi:hypothetical protein
MDELWYNGLSDADRVWFVFQTWIRPFFIPVAILFSPPPPLSATPHHLAARSPSLPTHTTRRRRTISPNNFVQLDHFATATSTAKCHSHQDSPTRLLAQTPPRRPPLRTNFTTVISNSSSSTARPPMPLNEVIPQLQVLLLPFLSCRPASAMQAQTRLYAFPVVPLHLRLTFAPYFLQHSNPFNSPVRGSAHTISDKVRNMLEIDINPSPILCLGARST